MNLLQSVFIIHYNGGNLRELIKEARTSVIYTTICLQIL